MKNPAVKLLPLILVALYAGNAAAQSCTAAAVALTAAGASGNSCQASSTLANFCSNTDALNGAGVAVYSLNVGASNSGLSVSVTTSAFHPYLAVQNPNASGCSSSFTCIGPSTQLATTGTATQTFANPAAAGTYYVVVGDTDTDSPGCGAFTIAVAGTLPVKLQKFSVN